MSKVYTYMVLAVGLTFLFKFAGLPFTGIENALSWMGLSTEATGISLGTFFLAVAVLFIVGTGTGIAISFITKSPSETYIIAPIALGIFTVFASVVSSIISYTKAFGFIYYIAWLLLAPLLVAFGIAIIQFWRGYD